MDIPALLRGGVATARSIFDSAHETVTHRRWIGSTWEGDADFSDVSRKALVEAKQRTVRNMQGEEQLASHRVTFIEQLAGVAANAGFSRTNPIDASDEFILPDGTTGKIIAVDGFFDAGTHQSFYSVVYLG